MLQYHFTWKTLSAMAGITFWNFYFRLFAGAIRSPQIIEFLTHLLRHIAGKLLIVWDGLAGASQPCRLGFRAPTARTHLAGISSCLCPGTESDRIHLGPSEATRDRQSLPQELGELSLQRSAPSNGCVAVQLWLWPSGNRPNSFLCNYIMQF